jgi:hypothetical protein
MTRLRRPWGRIPATNLVWSSQSSFGDRNGVPHQGWHVQIVSATLMRDETGPCADKVVLLGRTLEEYRRYFALDLEALRGKAILDVASGVSSFCAEARRAGLHVTAFDAIYELPPDEILRRCEADLDHVVDAVKDLKTYRWDFYVSPDNLRHYRERAYRTFLADYRTDADKCYVPGPPAQVCRLRTANSISRWCRICCSFTKTSSITNSTNARSSKSCG